MDKTVIDISVAVDFGNVLGGLMGAVIEAQTQAAAATVEFIENFGTNQPGDIGAIHDLKNIAFNYKKLDEKGESKTFTLELPLLSLVDIPAINVKTAKFTFFYDVTSTEDTKTEEKPIGNSSVNPGEKVNPKIEWLPVKRPIRLIGRVNKETNTSSHVEKNAGVRVDIEFEKSSPTVGLDRIIDMLELAATENYNDNDK